MTVNKYPWGKPYKVVMKRPRSNKPIPGIDVLGRLYSIVHSLFLTMPLRQTAPARGVAEILVTKLEIEAAVRSMPNRKDLAPNGISDELLKAAISSNPNAFERIFNRYISEGRFPAIWKRGKLVLILYQADHWKIRRLIDRFFFWMGIESSSKRSVTRVRDYLSSNGKMVDNQYRFSQGHSTLDALSCLKSLYKA